jgi:hypothetical protein
MTIRLFKNASLYLADLIYTAWVQAGSPVIYPNSIPNYDLLPVTLHQNYPNPFSGKTLICFEAAQNDASVHLAIYDPDGKLRTDLFEGKVSRGHHEIQWNADNYREGIYYLVMRSANYSAVRKLILVRER